jgi:SAM-dependent methyltransferase
MAQDRGRYSIAFQATQTPAHFALVAAMAGHPWRPRARMTLLDIGCGRGHVVHVLAAANPEWSVFGLDIDSAAIAEARELAARAGLTNAFFLEADLATLDVAPLPHCDVMMAHGVWSWVGDAARSGLLAVLAQRLKPGGLAYLGTNARPGMDAEQPLQRLLRHLAGSDDLPGAERAMAALRGMMEAGGVPLPRTPMLARLLADPPLLEPAFVAHEFLTPHWRPDFHEDLCAALAPAKLDFLGSCNLVEALPALVCNEAQQALMATLPAGPEREFIKDLGLPRGFRADLFVRGARGVDRVTALDDIALAACIELPAEAPVLQTGIGRATLPEGAWAPLRAALARGPARIGALRALLPAETRPHPAELLALLVDSDIALPVFRATGSAPAADRFNRAAAEYHAADPAARGHFALAAPVAAGGLPADALDLSLVRTLLAGQVPDGDAARGRLAARLPVWRRFGIIGA